MMPGTDVDVPPVVGETLGAVRKNSQIQQMTSNKEPCLYLVYDDEKTVVKVFDSNESCSPYAGGDYNGHCGGCDHCSLMQAEHSGYRIERLVQNEGETVEESAERQCFAEEFASDVESAFGEDTNFSPSARSILYKLWRRALHRKSCPVFSEEQTEMQSMPSEELPNPHFLLGRVSSEKRKNFVLRLISVIFPHESQIKHNSLVPFFMREYDDGQLNHLAIRYGLISHSGLDEDLEKWLEG